VEKVLGKKREGLRGHVTFGQKKPISDGPNPKRTALLTVAKRLGTSETLEGKRLQ